VALMDPMQIIDWHHFILTHTHRDNAVK
jgi:hypothetical protein